MAFRNYPVLHPWHSLDVGDNPPELLNAVIEVPANSKVKYELDKRSGLIMVDRILYGPFRYPTNYGFIPQSYCDDGDPLDILVYCQEPLVPRCLAPARVIGAMGMIDQGEGDDKIIAVLDSDPAFKGVDDVSQMPAYLLEELKEFFTVYKQLEKKEVEVKEIVGRQEALKLVTESLELYKKHAEELRAKDIG